MRKATSRLNIAPSIHISLFSLMLSLPTCKIHRTLVFVMLLASLLVVSMVITISYRHVDAQPNPEPSSIQEASIQSLTNQDRLLTKIHMAEASWEIAVNPETNMVYVNSGSTVSVINGTANEVVENITLTGVVDDIAVNPETNMVYVALTSSPIHLVHVIDGKTNDIVRNIPIEFSPTDIAVNPETNMVYLTDLYGSKMSIIDGHTNNVYNVTVNNAPTDIAVNPETNMVYVLTELRPEITVINGSNNRAVTNITIASTPSDVDVNSQTNTVYVTNDVGNRISVINGSTNHEIKTIIGNFTGDGRARLAVDNSTNLVYVAPPGNIVTVIDGTTNNVLSNFMLESRETEDLAINPKTHMIYATSKVNNIISVINGKKEIMFANNDISINQQDSVPGIKVGRNPIDIAVNPETNMIYVIYSTSDIVSVIDGNTNTIMDTITVGTPPTGIDVNAFTNTIYVTNPDFDSVIAIDGATNTVTHNITVSDTPQDLAINPKNNRIYTFNYADPFSIGRNVSISTIDGIRHVEIANLMISGATRWALDTSTDKIYVSTSFENITEIKLIQDFYNSSRYFFQVGSKISGLIGGTQAVVNPITNMLYVDDLDERVLEIDPYRKTVAHNYTVPSDVADIAVNPITNVLYATNLFYNFLSVINLKGNVVENITVGVDPYALAINPETNIIYVTNLGSDTISVINGHTNKVTAGVTFNINPSNAGFIECNGQAISDNYTTIYDTATPLECEAKANSGFQFSSWSGDLTSSISDENAKTRFTVSKYGALSANFINPVQITIPWELLAAIILSPIVGWLVPFFANRARENKRSKNLAEFMMKKIDDELGKPKQNMVEYLQRREELRDEIRDMHANGKISERSYEKLNNMVSEYEDKPM
jgi:YVTN family beta-propeller protein